MNFKEFKGKSGIYQIRNVKNNRIYIGSACNLYGRFRDHFWKLTNNRHENAFLQNDFNSDEKDLYRFYVIEFVEIPDLIKTEQKWLDAVFKNNCYNLNPTAGSFLGRKHSILTKQKIGKVHKNLWSNPQYRKNMLIKTCVGKKLSFATREKIKKSLKGRLVWNKGKSNIYSQKTINAITNATLSQWTEHDYKEKMLAILKQNSVNKFKPVLQMDKTGTVIKKFNSIKQASLENNIHAGSIGWCCKGKVKTAGGYIWRYSDDETKL